MSPSTRASRCRGPQPVRAQAELEASNAEKNACEINGLYGAFEPALNSFATSGEPGASSALILAGEGAGLAQASQSAAAISLTAGTDSRVISDESIGTLNWPGVTTTIVHADASADAHDHFTSSLLL